VRRRRSCSCENVALARDHRLRKQAAALVSCRYQVSVDLPQGPGNHGEGGIRIHQYRAPVDGTSKLGFRARVMVMAACLTLKVYLTEGFDAIQISGTPDITSPFGAPFKLLRKPLVLDQRASHRRMYDSRYGRRGVVYRVLRRLERASFRAADHVITVNRSLEQVAYLRGGVRAGTVTVVGNGRSSSRPASGQRGRS